jgi:DNA polymerase-3 subunit gamma/tau
MHAGEMPDPGTLVKRIEGLLRDGGGRPAAGDAGAPAVSAPVAKALDTRSPLAQWTALVEQVEAQAPLVGSTMRLAVRVIALAPGTLTYELVPGLPGDPSADIRRALETATGERWSVERGQGAASPSLEELRAAGAAAQEAAMHENPLVKAVMAAFPGARIVDEPGSAEPGAKPWSRRA